MQNKVPDKRCVSAFLRDTLTYSKCQVGEPILPFRIHEHTSCGSTDQVLKWDHDRTDRQGGPHYISHAHCLLTAALGNPQSMAIPDGASVLPSHSCSPEQSGNRASRISSKEGQALEMKRKFQALPHELNLQSSQKCTGL